MNVPNPRKAPFPSKHHLSKPTASLRGLRRTIRALPFQLRAYRRTLLLALVLISGLVAFAFRPFSTASPSKSSFSESDHPVHLTTPSSSAFSRQACDRIYDPPWILDNHHALPPVADSRAQIAYFIQVGDHAVPLLPRLFSRIHRPQNIYIVHIDAKVHPDRRAHIAHLIHETDKYQRNMHIMPSEMVTYKAISMVTNTIAAMTLALEKHPTWQYFINLSGADYPLVSPDDQALLLARPGVPIGRLNFISFFPKKEWVPYSFRVRNLHWDPAATGFQSNNSKLFLMRGAKLNPMERHRAYVFTKAEAWMILSRPFVRFVTRSAFAKRMLVNHVHVLSVPEHYFADILYNHPFWRTTIVPDSFRKVAWYHKRRRSGQHPYKLDKGSNMFSFWDTLAETKSLFARKFSLPNSLLMDRIDAEMSGLDLKETNAGYRRFRNARQVFLKRIISHFDELTKKTLQDQGFSWPNTAYPDYSSEKP